jgi:hypothetical protein
VEEARVEERIGTRRGVFSRQGQRNGTIRPVERAVRVTKQPEEERRGRQALHPWVAPEPEAGRAVVVGFEGRDRRIKVLIAGIEIAQNNRGDAADEPGESAPLDGGLYIRC